MTRKKIIWIVGILATVMVATIILWTVTNEKRTEDELLIHDVSRLSPTTVKEVVQGKEEEGLIEAVRLAQKENLKVSIGGAKHSQGGHAFYKDSAWLDMRGYDQILHFDEKEKTITVQSGATWKQIQEFINPYGLSVKVMQSSNIFTIGGSLSSNVHGRDPRYGTLIETVESFRLLMADGTVKEVSRTDNEELFSLVIGGYGLFGVILDVTLQLTDDVFYVSEMIQLNYEEYASHFQQHILTDETVGLHYARLSISPNSFLKDMYLTNYKLVEGDNELYPGDDSTFERLTTLEEEKNVGRNKFLFNLSRNFDWGKGMSWYVQQQFLSDEGIVLSRNNAMSPFIEFLEYESTKDTDILQEYFIPLDQFTSFVDGIREIVGSEDLNLLNATVRYTKASDEGFLNYAKEDTFAIVLLFNQPLSDAGIEHMEQATQKIVDLALAHGGTYYLTYQLYPSKAQIRAAYPEIDSFFEKKRAYDPEERFMNQFYEKYNSTN